MVFAEPKILRMRIGAGILAGVAAFLFVLVVPEPAWAGTCEACAKVRPKTGTCPMSVNDPRYSTCQAQCSQVQAASAAAASSCQQACGQTKALDSKGAADAADAASNMTQNQETPQFQQAGNSCKNQQNQLGKQQAAQQPQGPLQQCKTQADACKNAGGNDGGAGQMCQDTKGELAGEAGRLGDAAKQLGGMCGKSDKNGEKMGQMPQIPQMPQNKSGEGGGNPYDNNPWEDPYAKNDSSDTGETQQIETVKFDDGSNANGVSMLPGTGPSVISGNTGSGPTGYSSAAGSNSSGNVYGNGLGNSAKGNGFASPKSGLGSGAGLGGFNSSGSSRPGNGIAAADIKPQDNSAGYEVNLGGKSVLGLKGKTSEGDEVSVEDLAGLNKKGEDAKGQASIGGARMPAGGQGLLGANAAADGLSLFRMVKIRYHELRKIGEI